MNDIIRPEDARLHIRFEGRSWDLLCRDLDIGHYSSDDQVRAALAIHFDVPVQKFRAYVVERHGNGNVTVRPEAVFG
jgi:hypothetical protein